MTNKKKLKNKRARRKHYTAPALEKGLDILELLSLEPSGLSISQIADRQSRSIGEIFRMVAVLEQRGFIQSREDSEAYVLTLKMFTLSHRFPPVARLTAAVAPVMKELSYEINQSCHVAIYYEGRGQIVAQQDPPTDRILSVRLGAEAPLIDTCSGHLLLAYATDEERTQMIKRIPRGQKRPSATQLTELVQLVREQGYARSKSSQALGIEDIGYPIFDYSGTMIAAFVVPYFQFLDPNVSVDSNKVMKRLGIAAQNVSERLGFTTGTA